MAVAVDAVGPAGGGGQAGTSPVTWAHVNSDAANVILVGITDYSGNTAKVTSVTYGAVSLARVSPGYVASGNISSGGVELWAKAGGLPTGSNTVTVTSTGDAQNHNCGSVTFTGAGSLGTPQTSYGQSASLASASFTTTSGNMLAAVYCDGSGGEALWAATGGSTLRWTHDGSSGTAADNGAMATKPSPGGAATIAVTDANDYWGCVAVEVLAGGGTPANVTGVAALVDAEAPAGVASGGAATPGPPMFPGMVSRPRLVTGPAGRRGAAHSR